MEKTLYLQHRTFILSRMKYGFRILSLLLILILVSCGKKEKQYTIGVSQCSMDIWRNKLIKELKTSEYFYENVHLEFAYTHDNDKEQIKQIDSYINKGVDLLIVSPNQLGTITPVIEKAYDRGIPVILFDRKINSQKYTAFIGGDNYLIGKNMGAFIASKLNGRGRVMEICGLKGSSPAQDRHDGFSDELKKYPGIEIVAVKWADWNELGGRRVMLELMREYPEGKIDFVFVQNDRMAKGACDAKDSVAASGYKDVRITGVDGLSGKGNGIDMVRQGRLTATYIYPTEGDQVVNLALDILQKRPYQRDNHLISSIVTKENAEILDMQANDMARQADYLDALHSKADSYLRQLNNQSIGLALTLLVVVLLITVLILGYRITVSHARMNRERARMKDAQINFFTNVSHQIRTPLTLISDPIHHIVERGHLKESDFGVLESTDRNARQLMLLVNNILDFRDAKFDVSGRRINNTDRISDDNVPKVASADSSPGTAIVSTDCRGDGDSDLDTILVVDDNADIRNYVRSILQDDYRVIDAPDGSQGLQMAREEMPDLIVSDIMMPVMDGLEMCRSIKADMATSHIPVVMLTAKSQEEQVAEGFRAGADSYLTKPFSSKVLLARIENIMLTKRRLQAFYAEQSVRGNGGMVVNAAQVEKVITRDEAFIGRLHNIISAQMSDSGLSVEGIGAEIGLGRVQLYRKVKSLTGLTPVELIRKMRLAKGRQLLESTDKNVSEIAYEVGFSSPGYFTKCFHDEYGMPPGELKVR